MFIWKDPLHSFFPFLFFSHEDCTLQDVRLAVKALRNASAKLFRNRIRCDRIVQVEANAKGKIEIKKNVILPKKGGRKKRVLPSIQLDACSVDMDAPFPTTQYDPNMWNITRIVQSRTHCRSSFTKAAKNDLRKNHDHEEGLFFSDPRKGVLYKRCVYCDKMEDFQKEKGDSGVKLKFCTICRACYCSVECQREDWPIHKAHCVSFSD